MSSLSTRSFVSLRSALPVAHHSTVRSHGFHRAARALQQQHPEQAPYQARPTSAPNPHGSFYKTHGRALFKTLTLAFFSFQCFYWFWIKLETEELKDEKDREIKSLEGEVRLLEEGRLSHQPGNQKK